MTTTAVGAVAAALEGVLHVRVLVVDGPEWLPSVDRDALLAEGFASVELVKVHWAFPTFVVSLAAADQAVAMDLEAGAWRLLEGDVVPIAGAIGRSACGDLHGPLRWESSAGWWQADVGLSLMGSWS